MSAFDSTKFDGLGIYGGLWTVPTDVSEPYTFKVAREMDKQSKDAIQERLVLFIAVVKHAAEKGLGFFRHNHVERGGLNCITVAFRNVRIWHSTASLCSCTDFPLLGCN